MQINERFKLHQRLCQHHVCKGCGKILHDHEPKHFTKKTVKDVEITEVLCEVCVKWDGNGSRVQRGC